MKALKTLTQNLLPLLIIATLMASCSKGKDGAVGPQGEQGEKGDKGTTGAAGATGPKGSTGTANVRYSKWVYAVNFTDSVIDNSNLKIGHIPAPELTTDILNSASIQVFFTYGGGVQQLPYSSYAGGKLSTISYQPLFKRFIITRFTADNTNSVNLSTLLQYRYIIIPGGKALAATKKINMNNYEEVKRAYNIPD